MALVKPSKIMPRPRYWRDDAQGNVPVVSEVPLTLEPAPRRGLRSKGPRMTKARRAAAGMPCFIRLPGCDGGGDSTALCHYRLSGTCGAGMKPDDEQGAWGCHHCHAIVDGRANPPPGYTYESVRLAHAEGVLRTQQALRDMVK